MFGNQCQDESRLDHKVTIAADVDAVRCDAFEAELCCGPMPIDGHSRPRTCGRAEPANVDSFAAVCDSLTIACVLFDICQPVVRRENRLSSLQVRVGWQDHIQVAITTTEESLLKLFEQTIDSIERVAGPQPHVSVHLIVAAARSVKFSARIAQNGR